MLHKIIKFITVSLICLLSIPYASAIKVSDNVEIKVDINLVSKYVNYSKCVSYENIQPSVNFRFGDIDKTGVFGIKPWFSIGHAANAEKKLYMETDIFVYYTSPEQYITLVYKYVRYLNAGDSANNNDMQLVVSVNLVKFIPLSITTITTVYNDNHTYDTKLIISYDAVYKQWNFIPTLGYRYAKNLSYGYLEFSARRNVILSEKAGLFVQLSGSINTYDIQNSFTYQKNINGWLTCGFIF